MNNSKLVTKPINKLIWGIGIPMVFSMIAQALYNIIDTAFIINMEENGHAANIALGYAFPIQILMIAIGVGLGIGINSLLSKYIGESNEIGKTKVVGNGIFLAFVVSIIFIIFGIFFSKYFITFEANGLDDENLKSKVISLGTDYLSIVTILCLPQMLFTVYERFLQSTGRSIYSTIGQLAGALTNILLDYIFIYPLNLGVKGAAYATILGQFVSLIIDMLFHYIKNKEIKNTFKSIIPNWKYIKEIFKIGIPAMIMQGLLAIMMFSTNLVLGTSNYNKDMLIGSFSIYYKIQQIALFGCFGMSNTLITIISFNYGIKDKKRLKDTIKYGIIDALIVSLIITIIFESLSPYIAKLFGLASGSESNDIIKETTLAIYLGASSFIFMSFSLTIQGILQGFRYVILPIIISLLRLIVFPIPFICLFIANEKTSSYFYISFLISEILTDIISYIFLKNCIKNKINSISLANKNAIE